MNIDDIIPYERNARNNAKAIPVVAESIREFGFKGAIVLRSREDPTIVNGHTRVAACKSLGWTEFPDEYITYAEDLTDEQVMALRLADNRTGEVATWNKALLKSEMKKLDGSKFDMSRFQFDWKSKSKDFKYGQEAWKTDYAYNLHLVDIDNTSGKYQYPVLLAEDVNPDDLTSFNFCKTATDFNCGVHFCIDDYQFERVWNSPEKYLELLRKFQCVVTPDFSVYLNMPYPMKLWNIYRSRALGNYWQRNGLKVVPNVTYSGPDSFEYCLEGVPEGGTIFMSTIGVQGKEYERVVVAGMEEVRKRIRPTRVLLLGTDFGFDFGCEVSRYKTKSFVKAKDSDGKEQTEQA